MESMFDSVTWYDSVVYGVMIAVGCVSCFFGFKLFKFVLSLVVALVAALVVGYAGYTYGSDPVVWSVVGFFAGGILGGLLAYFFYSVAVAAMGGIFAGLTILPWIQDYEMTIQLGVIAIVAGIAALLTVYLTNLMLKLATAMVGGLLIVHGVNFFLTGSTLQHAVEGEDYQVYLQLTPMLSVTAIVVGLIGFFVQHRRTTAK